MTHEIPLLRRSRLCETVEGFCADASAIQATLAALVGKLSALQEEVATDDAAIGLIGNQNKESRLGVGTLPRQTSPLPELPLTPRALRSRWSKLELSPRQRNSEKINSDQGEENRRMQTQRVQLTKSMTSHDSMTTTVSLGKSVSPSESVTVNARRRLRLHPRWEEARIKSEELLRPAEMAAELQEIRSQAGSRKQRGSRAMTMDSLVEFSKQHRISTTLGGISNPNSKRCLVWDAIGVCFIIYDAISIPIAVAWDLALEQGSTRFVMFLCAAIYWAIDLLFSFSRGYFKRGWLVLSRYRVAKRYFRTWFFFDFLMLATDVVMIVSPGLQGLRLVRTIRAVRIVRLLRVLKMERITVQIEDVCGLQGSIVMLVFAITKTTFGIFLAAHALACTWYYLGREGSEAGRNTWLLKLSEREGFDGSGMEQYLHSLHWCLAQFTPAPVDIHAVNFGERVFTIFVIYFSLFVMGSSVSKMSAAIMQLNKANYEKTNTKLQVNTWLRSQEVPVDLSLRIIRFVEFSVEKTAVAKLEPTLLPSELMKEVLVTKLYPYLSGHALFNLVHEACPDILGDLCGVLIHHVHEPDREIFKMGSVAARMRITEHGSYKHLSDAGATTENFTETRYFAEVALFAEMVIHTTTLIASSHAGSFTLIGSDLTQCVKSSPRASSLIYKYAQTLLTTCSRSFQELNDEVPSDFIETAVQSTQVYQMLTLPEDLKIPSNGRLSKLVSTIGDASPMVNTDIDFLLGNWISEKRSEDGKFVDGDDAEGCTSSESSFPALSEQQVLRQLEKMFPEVHETDGLYARFSQHEERNRTLASMISVVWLLRDNLNAFTGPQPDQHRMTSELWQQLQLYVQWMGTSREMVHEVLVFLAIRSLGKVQMLVQQLPPEFQQPQLAVIYMMQRFPDMLPSVSQLQPEMLERVIKMFMLHMNFNFAQFIQGENSPANVESLKLMIDFEGERLLKVYMFSLLGMMSGLAGGSGGQQLCGSAFMDERRGRGVASGLKALAHLADGSPQAIYWGYIAARAKHMQLRHDTIEELAFARLACLTRVNDNADLVLLQDAWSTLGFGDQESLVASLVADGIKERTFVYTFLPLCFEHARNNEAVGVHKMLVVLVELIEQMAWYRFPDLQEAMVIAFDLSDLAAFIAAVKSSSVFQTCLERSKLNHSSDKIHLAMTERNWSLVDDHDGLERSVPQMLRQLLRKQNDIERTVMTARPQTPARYQQQQPARYQQQCSAGAARTAVQQTGAVPISALTFLDAEPTLGNECRAGTSFQLGE